MTLRSLGSLSLGQVVPAALAAQGAIVGAVGISQPTVAGQLSGIQLALSVGLPNPAQSLAAAQGIVEGILAAMTAGLPTPALQMDGLQAQLGSLTAQLGQLSAQLGLANALGLALGAAGAYAYSYDGAAGAFGPELSAELGAGLPGGSSVDHVNGIVIATQVPATWVAMQALFQT